MSTPVRQLHKLLHGMLNDAELLALPDVVVTDLTLDSRACVVGSAFVAIPGLKSHGLQYAEQAAQRGARVVLWQPDDKHNDSPTRSSALYVRVPELSSLLGELASRFFAAPSKDLRVAAVTGTNGKSTTAYLIAQAAEHCGFAAGYIGTVGCGRIGQLESTTHTTSDVLTVHRQLAQLRDSGAQMVAMEVSSHALHQRRLAGVQLDTAVFTNLTQDHLDYHGSMQAYAEAKALLFVWPGLRHQVINADDEFGRELLLRADGNAVAYTCNDFIDGSPVLRAHVELSDTGLSLDISGDFGTARLRSALLGRFNAENLLAALGVLLGWNVPLSKAVTALEQCVAPPGRMELIHAADKRAVIDYAHTPDALTKALQVLKLHCRGQLICVFGCGGDRDAGKRPQMGHAAAQLADQIILTDDNPRTENPDAIIAAIKSGIGDRHCMVERDRARAIRYALDLAAANDIVLIAGKGHEDYQIVGQQKLHFSDREVVRQILRSAA